jgi:hypothetical protein
MIARTLFTRSFAAACGLSLALACDPPQCIDGPAQSPVDTAACEAPPVAADPQVAVAHAEWLETGGLVITWTSFGLECGTRAADVELTGDCERTGWVFTVEIPPELAVAGTIDLDAHPEVLGTMTVMDGGNGGKTGTIGDEPFFTGHLELTQVAAGCVTGVLHGFGSGIADPSLGGPELSGGFLAPTC